MKKLKISVLVLIAAFILFWTCSIAVCEYNTYQYGAIFRSIKIYDIGGERYLEHCNIKVINYSKDFAKVYAVMENTQNKVGLIYHFVKNESGDWMFDCYHTVYSKTGSADGFVWPYIR